MLSTVSISSSISCIELYEEYTPPQFTATSLQPQLKDGETDRNQRKESIAAFQSVMERELETPFKILTGRNCKSIMAVQIGMVSMKFGLTYFTLLQHLSVLQLPTLHPKPGATASHVGVAHIDIHAEAHRQPSIVANLATP